jgi:hypothetical protein
MAQDYVCSNNLPLLAPIGQFGTRHMGGKDAASPRYIFTKLQVRIRSLFSCITFISTRASLLSLTMCSSCVPLSLSLSLSL